MRHSHLDKTDIILCRTDSVRSLRCLYSKLNYGGRCHYSTFDFYRAMRYAERGYATVCRPSVRP